MKVNPFRSVAVSIALLVAACMLTACHTSKALDPNIAPVALRPITIDAVFTAEGIGAGQGVEYRDGMVYLYGDRHGDPDTGIIREFRLTDEPTLSLTPTGRDIVLTRGDRELISHPTGLTHHPDHGTFIGDTVSGKGVIYHIDWAVALEEGNLDNAVPQRVRGRHGGQRHAPRVCSGGRPLAGRHVGLWRDRQRRAAVRPRNARQGVTRE